MPYSVLSDIGKRRASDYTIIMTYSIGIKIHNNGLSGEGEI